MHAVMPDYIKVLLDILRLSLKLLEDFHTMLSARLGKAKASSML